jgi:hypothetical protein
MTAADCIGTDGSGLVDGRALTEAGRGKGESDEFEVKMDFITKISSWT